VQCGNGVIAYFGIKSEEIDAMVEMKEGLVLVTEASRGL
jgi:hypothetical protein